MGASLETWRKTLESAITVADWRRADKIALLCAERGFSTMPEVSDALHLAVAQLGEVDEGEPSEGPPSEMWVEALVRAVWASLRKIEQADLTFRDLPIAAHSIGRSGEILAVTGKWCHLLGYQREAVIGRKSIEFLTDESRRQAIEINLPKFWRIGSLGRVEYEFVTADGSIIPVYLSAAAEFDADGFPKRSFAVISSKN